MELPNGLLPFNWIGLLKHFINVSNKLGSRFLDEYNTTINLFSYKTNLMAISQDRFHNWPIKVISYLSYSSLRFNMYYVVYQNSPAASSSETLVLFTLIYTLNIVEFISLFLIVQQEFQIY